MAQLERDIQGLERQHEMLRFAEFDAAKAWQLGSRLRSLAELRGHAMAIEVRLARRTVFHSCMPGATAVNDDWVKRKRNTAELFEKSSYWVGRTLEREGLTLKQKMGAASATYAVHGGAFPLLLQNGACAGCVTVSGIPEREDHALVIEAVSEMCGIDARELQLS